MSPEPRRLRKRELAECVATMAEPLAFYPDAFAPVDLLITVLGFEDRALGVPTGLASAGVAAEAAGIINYSTNPADNARNRPGMEKALASLCAADPFEMTAERLSEGLRALVSTLPSGARVAWDISVASNDLVIEGLGALLDCDIELELLYAEADEYRPTRKEFERERARFVGDDEMGLDDGVLDVEVSCQFVGAHAQQLSHELVVFPGFSRDRVRSTISKVDSEWIVAPERAPLIWMIGRPPHEELLWRCDALREIHGLGDGTPAEVHEVSTFDYRETLRALEEIYIRRGVDANLTVSALGSKMQSVGIALFCRARPEVRVLLARPRAYNAGAYSRGTGALWHVTLGPTLELNDELRRVGTLELVPAGTGTYS